MSKYAHLHSANICTLQLRLPVRRTIQEAPLLGEGYADPVPKKVSCQEDMFDTSRRTLAAPEAPQMQKRRNNMWQAAKYKVRIQHHDKTLQKDCLSR